MKGAGQSTRSLVAAPGLPRRFAPRNDGNHRHCERSEAIQSCIPAVSRFTRIKITVKVAPTRNPAVYIVANKRNGTLYTGVTSNLPHRIWQHREGSIDGFTKRYGCKLLVWYEHYETMPDAIAREKQIEAGSRVRPLALIEGMNPSGAIFTQTFSKARAATGLLRRFAPRKDGAADYDSVIASAAKQSRAAPRTSPVFCA